MQGNDLDTPTADFSRIWTPSHPGPSLYSIRWFKAASYIQWLVTPTLCVSILIVDVVLLAKGIGAEQRRDVAVDVRSLISRYSAFIRRRTYEPCQKYEPGRWFLFRCPIREYEAGKQDSAVLCIGPSLNACR